MAKAKTRRYHELVTPTMTSRAMTWVLLIVLPILGYLLGMQVQAMQDSAQITQLQTELNAQKIVPDTTTPSPAQ